MTEWHTMKMFKSIVSPLLLMMGTWASFTVFAFPSSQLDKLSNPQKTNMQQHTPLQTENSTIKLMTPPPILKAVARSDDVVLVDPHSTDPDVIRDIAPIPIGTSSTKHSSSIPILPSSDLNEKKPE